MVSEEIERVAVLGSGTMGHGIAEVVAIAGYDVTIHDVDADALADAIDNIESSLEKLEESDSIDVSPAQALEAIGTTSVLEEAVVDSDLVVEAAPERLSLKQEIFSDLDDLAPNGTILATNTSSLSISEIASATERPGDVVGMHFFNPPVKMELVEVVRGDATRDETVEASMSFVESIEKTPIEVRKDVRGFVVNSILEPFIDEPAWMVSEGIATVREADAAMVHRRGYPMGPFELSDLTGIDVNYHIRTEANIPVPPIMERKVEQGTLGRKSGEGYYEYDSGPGADYESDDCEGFDTLRVEARMVNEAAKLVGNDVATVEDIDIGSRLGTNFPEGPCRRGDEIGLDTVLEKLRTLSRETDAPRYEPAPHLERLVDAGNTGVDAGSGFYEYDDVEATDGDQYATDGGSEYRTINYTVTERGVLEIELDRPDRLNALSIDLKDECLDLLETVDVDQIRCVTIEGAGNRAFCAGADITEFEQKRPVDVMDVSSFHEEIYDFPRPVIAKIDGYCLGGGCELALACDLRIATTDSTFGQPEIRLGLIPGGGATQRLVRLVGETRAKELVYRGNQIDATTAEEWGLVNRAVEPNAFEDTVEAFLADIVEGPPVGLEVAKKVINGGQDVHYEAALLLESQGYGLLKSTEDVAEGTAAFLEDREPEFTGE
ncbi:3-hydroxyacyl-CoA dehydrogenase/enoyl-CoA hydratase family protein [Natrarchaeobius chitinivorans]|uniref:3-hydroxybutyryl-CoA dehydrogenase n=1 Tax=Natrarchaeobius chitinivorans TaxID=1679083 RepID=A0A3N6LXE7_NATCH|nr:3-hydroxyacyl-CoA dehydrogenase NAD-binding domain-containing protein [Natrarchaeobius chitinivorans]RQG95443.1 3-hydroxybutyryl-CoA dehydrogenase [Natrarchaeobius chitinivorans]